MEVNRSDVGRYVGRQSILIRAGFLLSVLFCLANFRNIGLGNDTSEYSSNHLDFEFAPTILEKPSSGSLSHEISKANHTRSARQLAPAIGKRTTLSSSHSAQLANEKLTTIVNDGADSFPKRRVNITESLQISRDRLATALPKWILDYFDWHAYQLSQLNETNWNEQKFIIARCTNQDDNCGGLSDRLRPVALLMRLAYRTNRVLLIRWNRPCPLEEFLQPTSHLNWTVPEYMMDLLKRRKGKGSYKFLMQQKVTITYAMKEKFRIIETRLQLDDGGEKEYIKLDNNTQQQEKEDYSTIYHGLFRAVFQPSQALAQVLQQKYDRLGLIPGEYTAAHLRAFYKTEKSTVSRQEQHDKGINAVNCASHLRPGDPIYFASDSMYSMTVVEDYGKHNRRNIVANTVENSTKMEDPLHLDFASKGNVTHAPSEYFETFVDILVLGNARCISYGQGGYAEYASAISFDPGCRNSHRFRRCTWKDLT